MATYGTSVAGAIALALVLALLYGCSTEAPATSYGNTATHTLQLTGARAEAMALARSRYSLAAEWQQEDAERGAGIDAHRRDLWER